MKYLIFIFLTLSVLTCSTTKKTISTQKQFRYLYEVNLEEFKDDKIKVDLYINDFKEETTTFCFPKMIPGIYGEINSGQFVPSITASDKNGDPLKIEKMDTNCWEIYSAKDLHKITYLVDDGWEEFDLNMEKGVYRSAESSFKSKSFVMNTNCLFGYFKNYTDFPFQINITKPNTLYAATSLEKKNTNPGLDIFSTDNYHKLVDNPILYSLPDTTLIKLPNIEVEVACFSTSNKSISKDIAEHIKPLLINQSKYLDGKLLVKKYTFIIYHSLNPDKNSWLGDGLEHSNSTLILLYMPLDLEVIKAGVFGIASHEFFHTLMPLGLHSHEISDYDFNNPKLSRHLWLYEGMTEYFTIHMPIKNKLQTLEEFIMVVERKMEEMKGFDNSIPMTELSLNSMQMQDEYYNVYIKGALLNLCLDIKLRDLSDGKYGVQNLVADLIEKYGAENPFEDDQLFSEIVKITGFSEIDIFIKKYIQGKEDLPLKEMLEKVGLMLDDGKIITSKNITPTQKELRAFWINQ